VNECIVLRRIFEPRREEIAGKWRKFHTEQLLVSTVQKNVYRVMKSRRIRCMPVLPIRNYRHCA
jgi:hypothetical protein